MMFELTQDQRDFATALDRMLSDAHPVTAARAWAAGDHEPGLALWRLLTDMGVPGLLVDEYRVEHVIAMEAVGRHAVPGPWIESGAYLASSSNDEIRKAIASGTVGTVAREGYALDADIAELFLGGDIGDEVPSIDPVRRLFKVTGGEPYDPGASLNAGVLAASAQLLGLGERMLTDSVAYVQQRTQFGRQIGSYQAIKHALADVRIALDFVRPLVYAAALDKITVSAAKIAAGDAAWLAARTALQVHGAIGYTREYDLSLWLLRTRALMSSWGTARMHRVWLIDELTEA